MLHQSDGLFRETVLEVATRYPDVAVDKVLADAMFALVVHKPEKFNVIVTCRSCKPRMLRKLGILRSTRGRVFGRIYNSQWYADGNVTITGDRR